MNKDTITTLQTENPRLSLQKSINRVLDESAEVMSGLRFGLGRALRAPRINVNVSETDTEVLVSADIPGMTAEDISIEVKGNGLTISGEAKEQREEVDPKCTFIRYERASGTFSRHIVLPAQVEESSIDGHCRNGVLMIRFLKKVAVPHKRQFTIANNTV